MDTTPFSWALDPYNLDDVHEMPAISCRLFTPVVSEVHVADRKPRMLRSTTVTDHIFSACRKVGVDTRDGLAHAAQTRLSCATR
jgi:hypothetical protein